MREYIKNEWVLDGEKIKKILKDGSFNFRKLTGNGEIKLSTISQILSGSVRASLHNASIIANSLELTIDDIIIFID